MEIITPFIIFSLFSIVNQIDYYFQNTSLASIWNQTHIRKDFNIDKEIEIKRTKAEFANLLSLVHNDVLVSENFEQPVKLVGNIPDIVITYPITNDPIDIYQTVKGGISEWNVGQDSNLYRLPSLQKYDQHLREGSIYRISKSAERVENGTLGNVGWINLDLGSLSLLIERNEPIFGSGSLRVDVHPAVVGDQRVNASWSGITSDFIPITNDTYYTYSVAVSAKDVDQLHSIVSYYNSSKSQIKEDYIFGGNDGTFRKVFKNAFYSPIDAKYVKLQMWLRPSIGKPSSYLVDNITITETSR